MKMVQSPCMGHVSKSHTAEKLRDAHNRQDHSQIARYPPCPFQTTCASCEGGSGPLTRLLAPLWGAGGNLPKE